MQTDRTYEVIVTTRRPPSRTAVVVEAKSGDEAYCKVVDAFPELPLTSCPKSRAQLATVSVFARIADETGRPIRSI